ncbi:hypothetical protein GCM10010211_23050 [Streptomyces albospinus]|uniref:Uncharacterized protein n=1 Tax=Streptomyces albospinus TaxID=285515 RepID=A0ABQ2UXG7_9ACTN|nr:hypothetical protein GCM10010211_23050 [Streptomyces albospinus]
MRRLVGAAFADELGIPCLPPGRQAGDAARRHVPQRAWIRLAAGAGAPVLAAAASTVGPAGLPPERRGGGCCWGRAPGPGDGLPGGS